MEQQAWILRGFLAQVESKEAEVEEAESGFTGEFLVSSSLYLITLLQRGSSLRHGTGSELSHFINKWVNSVGVGVVPSLPLL